MFFVGFVIYEGKKYESMLCFLKGSVGKSNHEFVMKRYASH